MSLLERRGTTELFVPLGVLLGYVVGEHGHRAGHWIVDSDLDSAHVGVQLEAHFLGRRARDLDRVVVVRREQPGEARHAQLTCVEAVPDVVHHAVERVVEADVLVQDVDWLDASVHAVRVKRLEDDVRQRAVATLVALPCVLLDTARESTTNETSDVWVVRDNLEVGIGARWSQTIKSRASEG